MMCVRRIPWEYTNDDLILYRNSQTSVQINRLVVRNNYLGLSLIKKLNINFTMNTILEENNILFQ